MKTDLLKQGYFYFKFYSNEIYKQAAKNPSLYFIVDVLTTELKKISILISEKDWDNELQGHLLKEILQLDNPPDYPKDDLDQSVNNGVRVLQIGLALHYIKIKKLKIIINGAKKRNNSLVINEYTKKLKYWEEFI